MIDVGAELILHYDPSYVDDDEEGPVLVRVVEVHSDGDFDVDNGCAVWTVTTQEIRRGLLSITPEVH